MKPSVLNRMKVTDEAYEKGNASLSKEVVLVAMDASRKITGYALEWALANVIQQGDKIVFLAILPSNDSSWKRWSFPKVAGECAAVSVRSSGKEDFKEIHKKCSDVTQQLQKFHDWKKVHITTEIVQFAERGIVASEAKRLKATWVVLDRHLKREVNFCLQEVHSNLVVVNRLNPKIFRLNLNQSLGGRGLPFEEPSIDTSSVLLDGLSLSVIPRGFDQLYLESIMGSSTISAASSVSSSPVTDFGTPSPSSFDIPVFLSPSKKRPPETKPEVPLRGSFRTGVPFSEPNTGRLCSSKQLRYQGSEDALSHNVLGAPKLESSAGKSQTRNTKLQQTQLLSELMSLKEDQKSNRSKSTKDAERNSPGNSTPTREFQCKENGLDRISSVRKEMHLSKHSLPCPPPLCSICQHKGPIFGKPPRRFTFTELQLATAGFSDANFLAEGGFGSVYRGLLPDGQPVAVKQHKLASAQGDKEFCSEVEVLSCAQHRNLVMLIGYCVEDKRRLLVYEFVCNGSLDTHLYGKRAETSPLEWSSRQKIAVGAARALRYLHEECRVGCIVHRDMRPNNILLTHDFEPMVGDFGLARWQPYGDLGEETRVIGAFGYLAPEYAQTGQITEKADVYSFGVVLLELVTGRKAIDMSRNKGEMCLTEWARPFLQEHNHQDLIDPRLQGRFSAHEVRRMLQAASLCIDQKPRPRMSQVLRLLEEDAISEIGSPCRQIGSPLSVINSRYSPASSPSTTRMFGISPITRLSSSSSSSNAVSPLSSNTPQQGGRRTTKESYAKYLRSTMLSTDSYRGMVKRTEVYAAGDSPYNGTSKSHPSEIYGTT